MAAPYPGTVRTDTSIDAPNTVERGDRAEVCVKVTTNGNGRPRGHLDINFSRGRKDVSLHYTGGRVCVRTSHLHKPGRIRVRAHFTTGENSVYKNSSDSTVIKVVRRYRK